MTDQKLAAEKNMLIGQEGEWKSEFFLCLSSVGFVSLIVTLWR